MNQMKCELEEDRKIQRAEYNQMLQNELEQRQMHQNYSDHQSFFAESSNQKKVSKWAKYLTDEDDQ